MRTEESATHADTTAEDAWNLYASRLHFEGFLIDSADRPWTLRASRASKTAIGTVGGVHAQSNKPLGAEAHFTPVGNGVSVTLALWAKDFVLYDTGEGEYIRRTLERLMSANLEEEPSPVVCAPSFSPIKALIVAGTVWVGIIVLHQLHLDGYRATGIALGLVAGAVLGMVSALHGLWEIRARPEELHGKGRALIALVALLLALAVAAAIAVQSSNIFAGSTTRPI